MFTVHIPASSFGQTEEHIALNTLCWEGIIAVWDEIIAFGVYYILECNAVKVGK